MNRISAVVLVLVLVLALAACQQSPGATPSASDAPAGQGETGSGTTLLIGMPLGLTGVVAEQTQEMVDGFNLYLEETGGTLGGVPVRLVVEDTESDPQVVVTKTQKLVEHDQVHLVAGAALAFEAIAVQDVTRRNEIAFVVPISGADEITQRNRSPYTVRLAQTSSQPSHALGQYAHDVLGFRRIVTVGQDYVYGWEAVGGFQAAFEQAGGTVVQKLWAPLETADYGPFVAQIDRDADAVFAVLAGANVLRFVKAYDDFGLKASMPLIGSPDLADQDALRYMGDEGLGLIHVHNYNPANPHTQPFVEKFEERYGKVPSYWGESTYSTAMWLDRAIQKIRDGGVAADDVPAWIRENPQDFVDVIQSIELPDAPRGPLKIDEYYNVINDMYIAEVVRDSQGVLTTTVIDTIPAVGQFGPFDPEEYLANPPYSRDYPPAP